MFQMPWHRVRANQGELQLPWNHVILHAVSLIKKIPCTFKKKIMINNYASLIMDSFLFWFSLFNNPYLQLSSAHLLTLKKRNYNAGIITRKWASVRKGLLRVAKTFYHNRAFVKEDGHAWTRPNWSLPGSRTPTPVICWPLPNWPLPVD